MYTSPSQFKGRGVYSDDDKYASYDDILEEEYCGYKNDLDMSYMLIEAKDIMLDELNVFDFGINDDWAQSLNFGAMPTDV